MIQRREQVPGDENQMVMICPLYTRSTRLVGFYGASLLKQQLSRKHDAYLVSLVCPNFSNLFLLVQILYLENVVIYHGCRGQG